MTASAPSDLTVAFFRCFLPVHELRLLLKGTVNVWNNGGVPKYVLCVFVLQRWRSWCASFVCSWTCWTGNIWALGFGKERCTSPTSSTESFQIKVSLQTCRKPSTFRIYVAGGVLSSTFPPHASWIWTIWSLPLLPRAFLQVRDP